MCFTCPKVLSNASIPQWPVGSNGVFLTGRLGVSHIMHISRKDYLSRNNTSGPPDMVFNVWCALSSHTAAVPQWPVGSNVVFLTGRLGVSHIMHISRDDYLSRNNTSGVFLTGRLEVFPMRQISGCIIWSNIAHSPPVSFLYQIKLMWISCSL